VQFYPAVFIGLEVDTTRVLTIFSPMLMVEVSCQVLGVVTRPHKDLPAFASESATMETAISAYVKEQRATKSFMGRFDFVIRSGTDWLHLKLHTPAQIMGWRRFAVEGDIRFTSGSVRAYYCIRDVRITG
jgi:hypothetical protein